MRRMLKHAAVIAILATAQFGLTVAAGAETVSQFKAFLLGWWRAETSEGPATVTTTIEYRSDGSYSGTKHLVLKELGQIVALYGKWSVKAAGDGWFALTRLEEGGDRQTDTVRIVSDAEMRTNGSIVIIRDVQPVRLHSAPVEEE